MEHIQEKVYLNFLKEQGWLFSLLPKQPPDADAAVHVGVPEIGRKMEKSDLKSTGLTKITVKSKSASLSGA